MMAIIVCQDRYRMSGQAKPRSIKRKFIEYRINRNLKGTEASI
jgi:hypothetical protein